MRHDAEQYSSVQRAEAESNHTPRLQRCCDNGTASPYMHRWLCSQSTSTTYRRYFEDY
jgi:hypothetical protein